MNLATKKKVYVALSLTHVKTDEEKDQVRAYLHWLVTTFDIELLPWAFDTVKWQPIPVPNIYVYDTEKVMAADLVIILYLTNEGSDGRGGEAVNRIEVAKKPVIAFAKHGVTVSGYPAGLFRREGIDIERFSTFEDMRYLIQTMLNPPQLLLFTEEPAPSGANETQTAFC